MSSKLAPLLYKPGIQRDGTSFQSSYCTDGQWVRFQRGVIKRMGGIKSLNSAFDKVKVTNILMLPFNNEIYTYLASSNRIDSYVITKDFNIAENRENILPPNHGMVVVNDPVRTWQSQIIVQNERSVVVFLAINNGEDIADTSAPALFSKEITSNVPLIIAGINIRADINGGMCYSAPFLFLYGSNGLVQYSKSNNPLDFTTSNDAATGGALNISNDKVIFGTPVRGGANSPSILFWTFSSVIRISNVGDETVKFRIDVISHSSSILSSRCVVEYDGLFYWPGVDRFFFFNGVVNQIFNTMNLNYFYDNIDMNKRQKVFGVKNPKYGEIWWYYPEKANAGDPNIGCTRALIYNKNENSWYDTALSMDAATFSNELGILAIYGIPLTQPDGGKYLWRQEYNFDQVKWNRNTNNYLTSKISSFITTPTFSWAAFDPMRQQSGTFSPLVDRWMELRRIEPDFITNRDDSILQVVVNIKRYAQSPQVTNVPVSFTRTTEKIDMRAQGRHMTLTFSSSDYFEMGHTMLLLGIGDGQ